MMRRDVYRPSSPIRMRIACRSRIRTRVSVDSLAPSGTKSPRVVSVGDEPRSRPPGRICRPSPGQASAACQHHRGGSSRPAAAGHASRARHSAHRVTRCSLANDTTRMLVCGRDADAHDRTDQRGDRQVVRSRTGFQGCGQRAGQRHQDDERIQPRLEVDDHQQ